MAQIFHPSFNTIARLTIFGAAFAVLGLLLLAYGLMGSPWQTEQAVVRDQPVPFSHEHHAGGLGIDCRYCHTTVETSSFAGVPPTYTCMSCHSQIWANSPMLEPVRASLREGAPLRWARVNDLPDFVYFHHGIHIQKGIGCVSCHGRVDLMPLTAKAEPLTMEWCLDCHRHPERHVRPRARVFDMAWTPEEEGTGEDQATLGRRLIREHHIRAGRLINCSICHR